MSDSLDACLTRIHAVDDDVRAWVYVDPAAAPSVGAGALAGATVGIKDIIDFAGVPTKCGAAEFAHKTPERDARVVQRLREAGAIVLGKTATTEFAYLAPAQTRNPWNLAHTPGGSSSGSAAAVASGMVALALGSQTVGSILRPAAYCGVVGMKPSYGIVSTEGVQPVSVSLDHIGGFARSVGEMRALVGVLSESSAATRVDSPTGRIGIVRGFAEDRLDPSFWLHLTELQDGPLAEFRFENVDIGDRDTWFEPGLVVLGFEAAEEHAKSYDEHKAEYRRETAELIEQGLLVRRADFTSAKRELSRLALEMREHLRGYDALLMPSAPGTAPRGIESTGDSTFCAPATFSGLPAISIPTGLNETALPLAIQLVGHWQGDARLLDLAERMERQLKFAEHTKKARDQIPTLA